MAKLRVAPETLLERMLPGLQVSLESIGYDPYGNIVLELAGPDVPKECEHLKAEITRTYPSEVIKLRAA